MSAESKCPQCGATIPPGSPDGLCAQCLFSLGLDAPEAGEPAPPPPDLAPLLARPAPGLGAKFHYFGDFELLEEIARGGMGVVFRARQISLNRTVALKLITAGHLATQDAVKRFHLEAEAAARLDHPNIVPIHEIGEHEGHHYFAMKLVDGGSLAHRIAGGKVRNWEGEPDRASPSQPPISASAHLPAEKSEPHVNCYTRKDAAFLVAKVARAVHYAHQRGILHRDLKPGNILLDERGEPHVTDFGLAKLIEDDSSLTHSGIVMGTPSYMSPEQAAGKSAELTTASDLWSLGAILYELLADQPPFRGATPMETLRQVMDENPKRPSALNPAVGRDLETICLKCLEKDAVRRYASAAALADDLDRWRRHEPILARRAGVFERVVKWTHRQPVLAIAVALLHLVLGLGLAGVLWQWRRAEHEWARAERERDAGQHSLYVANMNLAMPAWEQNNAGRVRDLLNATATFPDRGFEWFYWQRQAHSNLKTLYGHVEAVKGVAFSPDGQRIVTASEDRMARVWETDSGKELVVLKGHTRTVYAAAFSPDGRMIVTASKDGTARVWDGVNGRELLMLRGHTNAVMHVAFSPDGQQVATSSEDRTAKLWDANNGNELLSLKGHTAAVPCVAFSPDGRRLVTGSLDGTAKVWDAADGAELVSLAPHAGYVWSVAFSPNNDRIVTGDDRWVRVWNVSTAKEVFQRSGHNNGVRAVAFSPDGQTLLSSSEDQTARVWEISSKEVFFLRGHVGPVWAAAFSPDGRRIVTGSQDRTARIWEVPKSDGSLSLRGHTKGVHSVAFSADGQRIVSGSHDQTARVWETVTGKELVLLTGHANPIYSTAFSPDGQRIVTGSEDRTAKVWDATTGRELFSIHGHSSRVYSVAFSPDGQRIVTGGGDRTANVWDAATGRKLFSLGKHDGTIRSVAFSPDGLRIVSGSFEDTSIRVWDAKDGKHLLVVRGNAPVCSVGFSADSRRLVCGFLDWTAGVWDATNGKQLVSLLGHSDQVLSAAFSPDGKRIATASSDDSVKVWETATGTELLTLRVGNESDFASVAFSPDGRRVLAGGQRVRIWEAASPEQVEAWREEQQAGAEYVGAQERVRAEADKPVVDVKVRVPESESPQSKTTNGPVRSREETRQLLYRLSHEGRLSEAESLNREALAHALPPYTNAQLAPFVWQLADILRRQTRYVEAEVLFRENLRLRRSAFAATSEEVVFANASLGRFLADWAWSERSGATNHRLLGGTNNLPHLRAQEAEKLLRECLHIRGKATNQWNYADTLSRLGFALLAVAVTDPALSSSARSSRMEEVQGLLLRGQARLQKSSSAPSQYRREAVQRLAHLYEAWEELAPNTGKANLAAEWNAKLAEFDRAN